MGKESSNQRGADPGERLPGHGRPAETAQCKRSLPVPTANAAGTRSYQTTGRDRLPAGRHNKRHLGEHTLPKARVQDVVKEMRYMGKYHATENNCQKWVMELLRRLRMQAPPDQLDAETVVGSAKPAVITTIVGIVLAGAVVIVKGTFGVCS
ncbi:uncharacterized protein LOC119184693 [Rhipicephalus microplus]|uniref:uncharacterized protein LOC119184693 n=1 Tax=Rhipicephalus microplus TaxID=6941 RepID=UPI003F6D9D6C